MTRRWQALHDSALLIDGLIFSCDGDISGLREGNVAAANVTVSGNTCLGGNYNQIDFLADLDGAFASLTCEGNLCTEGGVARSAVSINASSVRGGVIRGNRCNSVNAVALRLIDTVDCVISGNTFNSGGPVSVAASGDCHGTYYASDNKQNGKILNSAMGLDVGPRPKW